MSKIDVSILPEIINNLTYLIELKLDDLQLAKLTDIIYGIEIQAATSIGFISLNRECSPSGLGSVSRRMLNPPEILDNLSNLTGLSLDDNRLTSLVETIGYFSVSDICSGEHIKPLNLSQLDLRYNQLTSIPEAICIFSDLTGLNLEGNQLTSLPENMKNLSNLEYLNIGGNQLTSLPGIFDSLSNLDELYLDDNQLTSLPESIGSLTYLTCLDLRNNQLAILPESIGNLPFLTSLDLSNNQLNSFPESIGNLADLKYIYIRDNYLKLLPKSISNLTNLYWIELCDSIEDLSILQELSNLEDGDVGFMGVSYLPRRYWTKLSDWKSEWLLDENNAEIRRILIQQIGYKKI